AAAAAGVSTRLSTPTDPRGSSSSSSSTSSSSMEVLVLIDFEGTAGDEMTVRTGDLVKKVTKASEEGWLEGELPKMIKQQRRCEVAFAYNPMNEDELPLAVGETIAILREIEDGWWLGMKDGKVGAFPSNFAKEIFVGPK
ncbi:hypothetical protein CRUP_000853, partial [Coryphaenoides rupestris]